MANGASIADNAQQQEGNVQAASGSQVPVITAAPSSQAPPPGMVVVQAAPVTTKKPAGSREAIIIGFAGNPEQFQVRSPDLLLSCMAD